MRAGCRQSLLISLLDCKGGKPQTMRRFDDACLAHTPLTPRQSPTRKTIPRKNPTGCAACGENYKSESFFLFSVTPDGLLAWLDARSDTSELQWFDREGKLLGTMSSPA